jgi:hypothetical protein
VPARQRSINTTCCIAHLLHSPLPHGLPQATLLLLEMLDVDKVLAVLASGQLIDEASYAFAAPGVKQRVNAELASWWPAASAAHSPVLLAWAAVLCLIGKSGAAGGFMAGHIQWRRPQVQLTALGSTCLYLGSLGSTASHLANPRALIHPCARPCREQHRV